MVKLDNERGSICISSEVFTWLAVQLLRRESMTKGVSVTPNDDGSITIELHIVVDHGVNIAALCSSIMNEVSYKVSSATDVSVRQVDVYVDSMTMD